MFGSRNGIDAAFVPGMAPAYSFDTQPNTADHSVMGDGFMGITGTGRVKTTLTPDVGAEDCLVDLDQKDQDFLHRFANSCQ